MRGFRAWLPLIAYSVAIVVVSHQSRPFPGVVAADKLLHFGAYALYGLAAALAVGRGSPWRSPLVALGIAASFAASDELHQLFVPGRSAELLDWIADLAGAGVGVGVGMRWFFPQSGP